MIQFQLFNFHKRCAVRTTIQRWPIYSFTAERDSFDHRKCDGNRRFLDGWGFDGRLQVLKGGFVKRIVSFLVIVSCFGLPALAQTANYPEVQLQPSYAADTGAVNVLTATVNSCPTAYTTGMFIKVLPNHANTTTTPTLNFCNLGAKTITEKGQSAIVSGDLATTQIATFIYDGTYMELQNPHTLGGVSSVSGDGTVITNSSSTGAVSLTIAGTSGGIVYFSSNSAWGSTGLLTQYGVLFGGGAAGAPTSSAQGASNMPLIGQGASNPTWSTIAYPTTCATGNMIYGVSGTQIGCLTGLISNSSGLLTTYDGITTAGLGVDVVEGVSDKTAQSSSLTTQNLITSTGAAGHYLVRFYIDQNGLCTTGTGSVYATVTWTDATAAHTAQTIPLTLTNTTISTASGFVDVALPFWSATSSAISYTTTYTACTSGTGTYDLHAEVERTN